MIQSIIEQKLSSELTPLLLQVINESNKHNVPKGSESHFKVIIVSDKFEGLSLLSRHRMVNKILANELANKIHALGLNTYVRTEWENLELEEMLPSPQCLSGTIHT